MTEDIRFNYEEQFATELNAQNLLTWIGKLHGSIANSHAWEALDTETHQQLMVLARMADARLDAILQCPVCGRNYEGDDTLHPGALCPAVGDGCPPDSDNED